MPSELKANLAASHWFYQRRGWAATRIYSSKKIPWNHPFSAHVVANTTATNKRWSRCLPAARNIVLSMLWIFSHHSFSIRPARANNLSCLLSLLPLGTNKISESTSYRSTPRHKISAVKCRPCPMKDTCKSYSFSHLQLGIGLTKNTQTVGKYQASSNTAKHNTYERTQKKYFWTRF